MFRQKCSSCGEDVPRNAKFCPYCRAPTGRGGLTCRYCGASIAANASFCGNCGRPTEGSEEPAMIGNTWRRSPEDFATRVEVDDLEGTLKRDLIIEPGTRAIILIDGRNLAGTLGPGRYNLKSFSDRISLPSYRRRATALLVDAAEVDLTLTLADIYTADPLKIALDCHVSTSVGDPVAFFTNLLKGQQSFTLAQLRSYLYGELRDAAQECVGERSATDLHTNLALKQEFATHIEAHLSETLKQTGLRFSRVRTMDFRHARWNELTQKREEYFLLMAEEEAKLEHRQRLFDVLDRDEIQDIFEETRKVEHHEKRIELRERWRRLALSDEFAELATAREREQRLREVDRERLIEDDEWERIQRTLREKREDELQARAHLLARLKLENDYELKQIELVQRAGYDEARLKFELSLERQRIEGQQEIEARRQEFDLKQATQRAAFGREEERLDGIHRREQELESEKQALDLQLRRAQTAAEINAIEREQDRLDAEMGMLALERMKAIRRKDEEEQALLQLRVEREKLEMQLAAEERRLEMRLAEERQAHEFDLARMERLKDLPPEAVVAATDAERGRIIADMGRTQAMKDMSHEQILAMVAANSPQAAEALAEIARAGAQGRLSQEQTALYDRLLDQNKEMLAEKERSMDRIQSLAEKALETQKETAVEIARAARPAQPESPTVVVTGPGGPQTVVGGSAGGNLQCRRCGTTVPAGTRFCTNCGYEFFPAGGA